MPFYFKNGHPPATWPDATTIASAAGAGAGAAIWLLLVAVVFVVLLLFAFSRGFPFRCIKNRYRIVACLKTYLPCPCP